MDTSSNAIWLDADNYDDFEYSRPMIFNDQNRDYLFKCFRITPDMQILDGGCGPGVLTRFIGRVIVAGNGKGTVTGFDLNRNFVSYANQKINEEKLTGIAKAVEEDGFNLSFADETFDAVVSHTYIGVLSDPVRGLSELIRVCKKGGSITVNVSSNSFPGMGWKGDYGFDWIDRLEELRNRQNQIYLSLNLTKMYNQSEYWNSFRTPKLLAHCGLKEISINSLPRTFAYNDPQWSDEFKIKRITISIDREIAINEERKNMPEFAENGFTVKDFDELAELLRRKQDYLIHHLHNDESWEWNAGYTIAVTGIKQ